MISPRITVPLSVALQIAERDGWKCHIDGDGYRPNDPWEIDHDIARAKGGKNLVANLRLAHRSCNREKSDA